MRKEHTFLTLLQGKELEGNTFMLCMPNKPCINDNHTVNYEKEEGFQKRKDD